MIISTLKMSVYPNVTEQDLIELRKLSEQQQEQRALKTKNRILKGAHDVKLAESLSPITKRLDEKKESTQKLGDVIKENNTPQLPIENTHNAIPIQTEQIQHGVIYDTSLEKTINKMKNNFAFFNREERDNGDILWNGFPAEKMGGNKLKNNEKIYEKSPGIQKVLTGKSNLPMKKLKAEDRKVFTNSLESLIFEN